MLEGMRSIVLQSEGCLNVFWTPCLKFGHPVLSVKLHVFISEQLGHLVCKFPENADTLLQNPGKKPVDKKEV